MGSETSGSLVTVRILLGRHTCRIENLRPAEHAFGVLDGRTGDEKAPIKAVIKEKEHLLFRFENVGQ